MKTLLNTAVLLMLASTAAEAKVLIYKATIRTVSDTETAFPRSAQTFFVIDPDQSIIGSVEAIVETGIKLIRVSPPSAFRFSEAPLPLGKTATTFSFSSASGGSNDFYNNFMIHGRGTNVSLPFSSAPVGNITTFPRTFHGIVLQDSAFNNEGSFVERRFVLSYVATRSIVTNDGNQTADQAMNAIVDELKLLGFTLP